MNRGMNRCSRWAFAGLFLATACAADAQPVRSERTISLALANEAALAAVAECAATSASLRVNTTALLELSQKNPAAANLGQIDGFMLVGGGLPIRAGNEVIGGMVSAARPAASWMTSAHKPASTRSKTG